MRTGIHLLLVVLLFACGKEPPNTKAAPPRVRFAGGTALDGSGAAVVDFGQVAVGRQARATLVLENLGNEPLPLEIESVAPPFSLVDAPEFLAPRALASLVLRYAPAEAARAEHAITIHAGHERLSARLVGEGTPGESICDFTVTPSSLRLTVGEADPGLDWRIPIGIEVQKGRCEVEAARSEGDLKISFDGLVGRVISEGMRSEAVFLVESPSLGQEGAAILEIGGREVEIPVHTVETPSCMSLEPPSVVIETDLECENHIEILPFDECEDAPGLVASTILPEKERRHLGIVTNGGTIAIHYGGADPHHESEATAVFDFDNGDRLYLPVTARVKLREERLVIPKRPLDLLLLVDKGSAIAEFDELIDEFIDALWDWMNVSEWDVSVGVTTTAMEGEEECSAEAGRLLPLDGSTPKLIRPDMEDGPSLMRDRLLFSRCGDPASEGLDALWKALSGEAWPWLAGEGTKVALILAAENHPPSRDSQEYRDFFRAGGLSTLHLMGPCGGSGGVYGWVAGQLSGLVTSLCDELPYAPILDSLEEAAMWPHSFPLDPPAAVGDPFDATEEDGIAVFVDGVPLYSGASPGWIVTEAGSIFRVGWGFAPGTEILVRYPERSCRTDDS